MGPNPSSGAQPALNSSKRKPVTQAVNNRADAHVQRRSKLQAARNIPTQPAESALKDGELDLVAFVAAHEFEIKALEQSMATSKAVSSTRAFQMVPRGLRRRTASHNPKRVPRRLRARAKREMEEDNAPLVESRRRKPRTTRARIRAHMAKRLFLLAARKKRRKLKRAEKSDEASLEKTVPKTSESTTITQKQRPKIRRNVLNDPPKPASKFRKRQINKTWLPTHQWHAKRARMTDPKDPLWRFAIPLTPNEKIYRPTHRAQGERGTMVWDMSYMSTIGLYGNAVGIARVLKRIGLSQESCWNDRGAKWRLGTRAWNGILTKEVGDIHHQMCPATIMWNPELIVTDGDPNPKRIQRQVFIRLHPASFLEVFNELLRLIKMENPRLYIEDLRFEIGSLEFSGPASTETLLAVLTPYPDKSRSNSHAELFQSLRGISNPSALPANAVLNFRIQDPRLRYPLRKLEPQGDPNLQFELFDTLSKWPAEDDLQPSALFDRDARFKASCYPSQKAINRRRSNNTPGSFLKPSLLLDPPMPVTLIASRSGHSTQTQGTWTLLAPWKCILPLWYSIVHCPLISGNNPRFAGLNETMQVTFERGLPWFPTDFLGTDAGASWELEQRRKRERDWSRRQKSKRAAWDALDLGAGRKGEVGNAFACDFEYLFGLERRDEAQEVEASEKTSHPHDDAMDVDQEEPVKTKMKPEPSPLHLLNAISKTAFNALVASSALKAPTPHSIIQVRIQLPSTGVVGPCARIYRLPSAPVPNPISSNGEVPSTIPQLPKPSSLPPDLRSQWLSRLPQKTTSSASSRPQAGKPLALHRETDMETRMRLLARELTGPPPPAAGVVDLSSASLKPNRLDIDGRHPLVPDPDDLIGFVTTGSFCLSEGRGAAVGSLAVDKVLAAVRGVHGGKEGRCCILRNVGENVGWVGRWEVL